VPPGKHEHGSSVETGGSVATGGSPASGGSMATARVALPQAGAWRPRSAEHRRRNRHRRVGCDRWRHYNWGDHKRWRHDGCEWHHCWGSTSTGGMTATGGTTAGGGTSTGGTTATSAPLLGKHKHWRHKGHRGNSFNRRGKTHWRHKCYRRSGWFGWYERHGRSHRLGRHDNGRHRALRRLCIRNTPCVAAHSTVRVLLGVYKGSLYQVRRASDNTTKDIGILASGGFADSAVQDTFCSDTTCTISIIYDSPGRATTSPKPGGPEKEHTR